MGPTCSSVHQGTTTTAAATNVEVPPPAREQNSLEAATQYDSSPRDNTKDRAQLQTWVEDISGESLPVNERLQKWTSLEGQ